MKFANYLQRIRSEKELTQQSLLELLIEFDDTFSKLDLTTLSRWERGVTTPKLEKQVIITRLMDDDIAILLDPDAEIPQHKKNSLDKVIHKVKNPYEDRDLTFYLKKCNSFEKEPLFFKKLQIFHKDYLGIKIDDRILGTKNIFADLYINDKNELVGHLLYGYVSVENGITSLDINTCDFIKPSSETKTMLYIISAYSSLSKPRSIIILSILDQVRKNTSIITACINCHDQDGFNLYDKNSKIEVIKKGEELNFGGIKLFGKHYRYVQILVNIESVLASKVIADLIPFTCKYIEDLLQDQKVKT